MRTNRQTVLMLALGLFLVFPSLAMAQQGTVSGRVVDEDSGNPIPTAYVAALSEAGREVASSLTNSAGRFVITVPPGTYEISVSAMGYGTTRGQTVDVATGSTATMDFRIARRAFELSPLVISVARTYEKAITSPAHVEIVGEAEIQARPSTTPVDHLRSVPGVDVITQGVQSTNVVVRGFNNIFSGALHALTDNRIAGVPSLRVNVMNFVPATDDDIERMEVVLGPGAALYGPNTANGVLHMITKSPLRSEGTSLSIMGGEQSLFGASLRTAQRLSDSFGVKLSGQYLRAEEWEYFDPVELAEQAKFASDPDFWEADLERALDPIDIEKSSVEERVSRIGARDFDIERWSAEVRADWEVSDNATAVFTTGISNAGRQIELTGLGAGQARDWQYTFYQARLNWDRLFTQFYLNQSDAGGTFLLRNGAPIIDRSKLYVGQVQHSSDFGLRQSFVYGVDFIHTDPDTEGTINGIYEDEDDTSEWGIYLQSQTQLTSQLDLVVAGRWDEHSGLPEGVFSPRAALVFEPVEGQAFRATFNRAFSTPSSLNQFLDLGSAIPDQSAARLGYSLRIQGTGTEGFQFGQPGAYQMRSPFTPDGLGGPVQLLPAAGAAAFWDAAIQVLAAQAAQQGAPLDPDLVSYLLSLDPTPADISANYSNLATGESGSLASLNLPDVEPIRESTQTTFELGYKGILSDRVLLAADVWFSRRSNLVTPLTIQTPFVLLNGPETAGYLVPNLMAIGMSQPEAEATAAALADGLARIPLGVISSADVNANGAQLLMTYTNVDDEIDLWGVDLSGTFLLSDEWSISGSASFVSDDHFTSTQGQLVTLNAPSKKGTLALNYRRPNRGLDFQVRGRYTDGFPASSGVYEGMACLDGAPVTSGPCVDSHTLVDMNVSYRIPQVRGTTVQLSVQNVFDEEYRSFPGVPEIGRMALLRLRYQF